MDYSKKYSFDPRTQEILEHLTIPFAVYQYIDKRVVTIALSKGFCDEFGFAKLEDAYKAMDNDMYRATHPDDKTRVADAAYRFAAFDAPYDIVYRTRTLKDPDYIILHSYGQSIYPEPGVRLCLTWYAHEGHYSEDKGVEESILSDTLNRFLTEESKYRGTYYDYMTGLPNMAYFYELAQAGCRKMEENDTDSAIIFFDLTGLKNYNHLHGFDEGDHLIRDVAALLARNFSSESCARFTADHFAAFAPEKGLKERLEAIIYEWDEKGGGKILPLRVGVYPNRIEKLEIGAACDRAKLASDARKKIKESYYAFFDREMLAEEKNRQDIIDNFEKALKEGWIKVYYQPIVRSTSGKVCNVEALARWDDPVRGLLMPASFIPVLEDSGLIHKLDLYVLKQVIKDIKKNRAEGKNTVPASINFSRADFDACDLVNEICSIVDKEEIDHKMINIEITESIVGSDFEFMKEQIEHFRQHGFEVWMDDFGSGYSSLDVLQSIKFDLIKFDMAFTRKLDQGEEGKIIITQLVKMITALGADTLCEGVENEDQYRFLQEIGCAKLQGYYILKPVPPEKVLAEFNSENKDRFEDPHESDYYDMIGRVNLHDLTFMANLDDSILMNTFDTIPMAIIETKEEENAIRFIRINKAFKEFMNRYKIYEFTDADGFYSIKTGGQGSVLLDRIRKCRKDDNRTFIDEEMDDGSIVHSFIRYIGKNPLSDMEATALAVFSISEPDESTTYADIASALASDYYNIYIIDLDTNDYIEYASDVGDEKMSLTRHGEDFFASARRDTLTRIYEEDREHFLSIFNKENVVDEIEKQGAFTTTYRLIDFEKPVYVNMKITRMHDGNRLILGVSIIDAHMKQLVEERRAKQERIALGRIAALSPNYIVLYMVDPVSNQYTQYNPSSEFEDLNLAKQGDDFFKDVILDAPKAFAPEDLEHHLKTMTKENILREIENKGFFVYNYRFILGGRFVQATLRAAMVEENGGRKIIIGVTNDEEEYNRRLEDAYKKASDDVVIYNHVAHALARECRDLYYVNMQTDEFIAFHTDDGKGVLSEARRGNDFFDLAVKEVRQYVHPDDRTAYLNALNKKFLNEVFNKTKEYELIYRRIDKETPLYVQMKISRMEDDERIIVIAISDIDELMRKRLAQEKIEEERIIYARLHALTGNFIVVYVVDPETGDYREFSATNEYEQSMEQAKEGKDFFNKVREVAKEVNHPDDLKLFLSAFTRENIMKEIEKAGSFTLGYRFMMDGEPVYVQMRAAMVEEKEGPRLIVGLNNIDAQTRQEQEFANRLNEAQSQANIDALTGVKNKHAFLETEAKMDNLIAEGRQPSFAVVMLDLNDLKVINDTEGHQAGDRYIKDACMLICNIFKHSPVFRVGGDEFVAICQGSDYKRIEKLLEEVSEHNREAMQSDGMVIACGMARYDNDNCVASVFERADHNMYENKNLLKTEKKLMK